MLTGVVPYGEFEGSNPYLAPHILSGRRPPRPTDPSQNRWLPNHVWDTITTCWSYDLKLRCELSVLCHVFSTSSLTIESAYLEQLNQRVESPLGLRDSQDSQSANSGESSIRGGKTSDVEAGPQQRGKLLPRRISSFFQFLRHSEPEIERHVNDMDRVDSSTFTTPLSS